MRMLKKYGATRGQRGIKLVQINDKAVRFETKLLASKLLMKCHSDEVTCGVIHTTKKCVARV